MPKHNAIPDSMKTDDYLTEKRAFELMGLKFGALHIVGRPSDVLEFEQAFMEWKRIYAQLHEREPNKLLPLPSPTDKQEG